MAKTTTNGSLPKLLKGEQRRPNGTYAYRWQDDNKARHVVYAPTLTALRELEKNVNRDLHDRIKPEARNTTLDELYELWKSLKRGLRDNTFANYQYLYEHFVSPVLGAKKVVTLLKSDVKRFYNSLADECCLKIDTIDGVHTVLHQVLNLAVDDLIIRLNPSDNVLKELKQTHVTNQERRALTAIEQERFLSYLKTNVQYKHWYPIFAVMLGTGLRVGEVTGLRCCDVDFENEVISVNHTLICNGQLPGDSCFTVHAAKTKCGMRTIPMLGSVKEALQEALDYRSQVIKGTGQIIAGYTDFIFVNRFGKVQHQGTLNKAIKRITRDYNDEELMNTSKSRVLLPHFSCHSLRHTFATRLCEAKVNIKVIQSVLGHADVSTTLNIYTEATERFKKNEFDGFSDFLKNHNE